MYENYLSMKAKYFLAVQLFMLTFFAAAQEDSLLNLPVLQELSLEELTDVKVVTASGTAQEVSDAPSTIRVITAGQIAECGRTQLEDVLRDMEGVDFIHIGGYMPTIFYFRGLYGAENLRTPLLIDGIKENNIAGTNDLAGPAYSLHNIERIEIIWDPASALYGADAFGGVINIITKNGSKVHKDVFFTNLFSGFLNFKSQKGKETDLGTHRSFSIPILPIYKGNIGITFPVGELFTVTAIGNWIGQRQLPRSNPYGADKGYRMDGYFLTHLVLSTKKLFKSRVSASVNVKNVFNLNYLEPGMRTAVNL